MITGGVLGSAFTQLNLLICRTRKKFMAKIKGKHAKNLLRMLETLLVLLIVSCVHIFMPALIGIVKYLRLIQHNVWGRPQLEKWLYPINEKEEEGGSSLLDCTVLCIKKLRSLPPFLCILLVVFVVLYWFYISVLGGINFAKLPDYQLEASLK